VQRGLYLRRAVLLWGAHRLSRQKGLIRRHMPNWQWFQQHNTRSAISQCATDYCRTAEHQMERWRGLHPWWSGIMPLCRVVEVPACAAGHNPAPRRPDLFDCAAARHCVLQFVWKLGHSACDLDRDFRQQILCMSHCTGQSQILGHSAQRWVCLYSLVNSSVAPVECYALSASVHPAWTCIDSCFCSACAVVRVVSFLQTYSPL